MLKYLFRLNALIIVILFLSMPVYAYAYENAFDIEMPESVNSGRSFDIRIKYNGDSLLGGIWLNIKYDPEYFSFKSFSAGNSTSDHENKDGRLAVICLFNTADNEIKDMTVTFTSKTGVPSETKSFEFTCVQAVSSDGEDIDTSMTSALEIRVIRKSDSADTQEGSLREKDTANKSDETVTGRSKTSKAVSSKAKKESSRKSSSAKQESKDSEDEDNTETFTHEGSVDEYSDETSLPVNRMVRMYESESKAQPVIAGAVGALAAAGILFGLYKLGKIESKHE